MQDLLDKTLSPAREQELKGHLAECGACREEFQRVEEADGVLRDEVCVIMVEVEVPEGLGRKVADALAVERSAQFSEKRPAVLKNLAVAAALLLVAAGAGVISFYSPFGQATKQQALVMPQDQDKKAADDPALPAMTGETPASGEPASVNNKASVAQERADASGALKGQDIRQDNGTQPSSLVSKDIQAPARPLLSQDMNTTAPSGEAAPKSAAPGVASLSTSATSGKGGTSGATMKKGTLDEAAGEAGFSPAIPVYLPAGSQLLDVAWQAGIVSQSYLAGQRSFIIRQSRSGTARLDYDEGARQATVTEINGVKAIMEEAASEAGEGVVARVFTTIRWQQGEWIFSVGGELPRDEIIRIASSLR